MPPKIRTYESDAIAVEYDLKRCIHARECVKRLPSVFDPERRPWVAPANATADEVAAAVIACPSGALQHRRKDGGPQERTPATNEVWIEPNGPLYLRGALEIQTPDGVTAHTRVALCRCGASHNKPFCDNSHRDIGFEHSGGFVSGENESTKEDVSGHLVVEPQPNGPLLLEGTFRLVSGDREQSVVRREQTWCCRCGHSQNKPFCDSSHRKVGFEAE